MHSAIKLVISRYLLFRGRPKKRIASKSHEGFARLDATFFSANNANRQPIYFAVSRGYISVVEYLLSYYDITSTPLPGDLLYVAVRQSYLDKISMARLLLDHGAEATYTTADGKNLLHILLRSVYDTSETECVQITQILGEAGCSLSAPDIRGITPLYLAVTKGYVSIVDYLLSRNVTPPSDILFSALGSCTSTLKAMISLLALKGADMHARDGDGNTMLHQAMIQTLPRGLCLEITRFCVTAGCNTCARNNSGHTPFNLAHIQGHTGVADYLRSRSGPAPAPSHF